MASYNCGCTSTASKTITTTTPSSGCLCAKTYRNFCSDGPDPCSDTFQIDLTNYVENGINDSETYSLVSFDADGFSSVTISSAGIVDITTSGEGGEEYNIEYQVSTTEGGKTYRINGNIYLCLKDLCKGVDCADGEECENCTGNCVAVGADLEV